MAIDRATFAGTDLDQAMQRLAQIELNRPTSIMTLFDRSEQERALTHDNVIVDNYHFDVDGNTASTMAVATRTEKADYQTPKEFSLSQQSWKISEGGENSFKMYKNDIRRSSRGRQRILDGSAQMRSNGDTSREDDLVKYLDALTTYTTANPAAANLPKLDNTGPNGNAGAIFAATIGAAANTISNVNGALNGNATQKLATANALIDHFLDMLTRMYRRSVINGVAIGPDPGAVGAIMPPEVARAYLEAMKLLDINNEAINRDIYQDAGIFTSEMFRGTLFKIPFAAVPALPLPASATAGFDFYFISPRAVHYAEDGPYFWSQTPREEGGVNEGPYFSYHQRFEWGRKLINRELLIKATARSAAPS